MRTVFILLIVVLFAGCSEKKNDELVGYWTGNCIIDEEGNKYPFPVIFKFTDKRFKMRVYNAYPKQKIYNEPGSYSFNEETLILHFTEEKVDTHQVITFAQDSLVLSPKGSDSKIILTRMKEYKSAKQVRQVFGFIQKNRLFDMSAGNETILQMDFQDGMVIRMDKAGSSHYTQHWTLDTINDELYLLLTSPEMKLLHVKDLQDNRLICKQEFINGTDYTFYIAAAKELHTLENFVGKWKGDSISFEIVDTLLCTKTKQDTFITRWDLNTTGEFFVVRDLITGLTGEIYHIDSASNEAFKLINLDLKDELFFQKEE